MTKILALIAGSVAGGLARYGLSGITHKFLGLTFPYGTLAVNLIGCYLIGVFMAYGEGRWPAASAERALLMAGFCGAFTTFSAFMLETDALIRGGQAFKAVLYVSASLILGFVCFRLGALTGRLA